MVYHGKKKFYDETLKVVQPMTFGSEASLTHCFSMQVGFAAH